ncbi:MAG TPA: hypothetical protein VMC41_00510 [Candidatus Nanoarchaeia archaeon]|nr:hypothetical protein [Candidatus Nanoarchaeia archaeon]
MLSYIKNLCLIFAVDLLAIVYIGLIGTIVGAITGKKNYHFFLRHAAKIVSDHIKEED